MASAKLALRKAVLNYSTITASTSLVSSINTRAITYSTLSGSTINAATLFVNGSQITTNGGLSSQWTTSGSNIYYNTGSVGIGSTSPQYKLDVAGDVNVTGGFYVNGSAFSGGSSQWTTTGSNISYITGSVGIGISSPSYRLHVGVMDNTYNLAAYLGSGGVGNYGNNSLLNSTSLFIAGWGMTAAAWGVTSDRRIKTNIESVSSMLKIIDQINVVKYDYIDPRFGREECSVIAQELKEVFPNAINMTTDFITNIMKRCTHVRDYDTVTLHVSLDNTLCIQSGCRIKIIQLDTPENEIITTIQSIDVANNRMVVSTWNNYSPASNIFVYGTEVDDFLSVDKPQLGVMALQGVKELHQIIRQQEERIVRLEALLSSRAV